MVIAGDEGCVVEETKAEAEHGEGVDDGARVGGKEGVVEEGDAVVMTSDRGGKRVVGVGEATAEDVGPVVGMADGKVWDGPAVASREASVSELVRVYVEEVKAADV